jgi:hypothetical protein
MFKLKLYTVSGRTLRKLVLLYLVFLLRVPFFIIFSFFSFPVFCSPVFSPSSYLFWLLRNLSIQ